MSVRITWYIILVKFLHETIVEIDIKRNNNNNNNNNNNHLLQTIEIQTMYTMCP